MPGPARGHNAQLVRAQTGVYTAIYLSCSRAISLIYWLKICFAMCLLGVSVRASPADALHVEYGACAEVLSGPRCVLGDERMLLLWVRTDPGATITVDDGRRTIPEVARYNVDGGTHIQLEVSGRAQRVRVRSTLRQSTLEWSIELAEDEPAPQLDEMIRLYGAGELDAAKALILQLANNRDYPHNGAALRLAAVFLHSHGDPEDARKNYERALERTLSEGRWVQAIKTANGLSYLLQHSLRDFAAAREVYAPFARLSGLPASARYFEHYDGGLLGFNTGDRRAALHKLDVAARQAARMGATRRWLHRRLDAEEVLASQLQRLGRRAEANEYFDAWRARDLSSLNVCERAYFKTNLAWSALLSLEAGDAADDPTPLLDEALIVMREHCRPPDIASAEINLALAHYHAARFDEAEAALGRARDATEIPELRLRFWELDIGARLAAARDETDVALAMLDSMKSLAGVTLSPDASWRAAARRGVVLERLGRRDDALVAYAAADVRLASDLQHVPVFAGRGQFAATRDWVLRRRLDILQTRGAHEEMAELVRVAHRRTFDALAARSRPGDDASARDAALAEYQRLRQALANELGSGWRVPADELALLESRRAQREQRLRELLDQSALRTVVERDLAPPQPGDLQLAFHPLTNGWLTIALTSDATTAYAPNCARQALPPNALAQCLIDAVDGMLSVAERVLITPTGPLLGVDFHTLEYRDQMLLDHVPVLYSLDQAPGGVTTLEQGHALVIGDATRQLPASRDEAASVARRLTDSGRFTLDTMYGEQADFAAVNDRIARADLLHFAGHATFESRNAWTSGLALARGEALTIGDVLSLERAPANVVLSACDTARADANSAAGTLGLAQAFVLRGARAVVATARPVRDADAQAFSDAFYAHWGTGVPAEQAVQRAQLALRQTGEAPDWAAFRLIVP